MHRLFRLEIQRDTVDTVTQPGRPRAVGEDMAQMAVTGGAAHLNAVHAVAMIMMFGNRIRRGWRCEARPTGTAVEFFIGPEQQRAAAATMKGAIAFFNIQRAAKGALRTRFTQDMILYRGKARTPFIVAEFDFFHSYHVCFAASRVKVTATPAHLPKIHHELR